MKSLKDEGVPFGARVVFRLQYLGMLLAMACLVMTFPAISIWAMIHDSGVRFLMAITDVLEGWAKSTKAHRDHVVALYADRGET